MTATQEEQATTTVTVPRAVLVTNINDALRVGQTYPSVSPTTGHPINHPTCLILPSTHERGWPITGREHVDLLPYVGMKGWWVRAIEFTIDGTTEVAIPASAPDVVFSEVPEEYRASVPQGARWGTLNRAVDGCPPGRFLAIPPPESRTASGAIIMAWPGHAQYDLFSSRPGVTTPWRGWWSMGSFTFDPVEAAAPVEDSPIGAGDVVRVLRDDDQPENNGRRATVIEHRGGEFTPYRVRYDNGDPGGERGWWVSEVERWTDSAEDASAPSVGDFVPGQLVEVHDYDPAWNGEARVTRVGDYVHVRLINPTAGQRAFEGGFGVGHVRAVERPFQINDRVVLASAHVLTPGGTEFHESPSGIGSFAEVDRVGREAGRDYVHVRWEGGGTSSAHPSCLRLAAPAEADESTAGRFPVGHWYSWGVQGRWFRVSAVVGTRVEHDRTATASGGFSDSPGRRPDPSRRDRFVIGAPDSDHLPAWLRNMLNPPPPQPEPGTDVETLTRQLQEAREAHQRDLDEIARIMKEEADEREWCSEYEEVAARIDRSISGTFRGQRNVEVVVDYSGYVQVPYSGRITIEVPPGSTGGQIRRAAREFLSENGLGGYSSLADVDWTDVDSESVSIDDYNEQ